MEARGAELSLVLVPRLDERLREEDRDLLREQERDDPGDGQDRDRGAQLAPRDVEQREEGRGEQA
jgi:hypothetical protein